MQNVTSLPTFYAQTPDVYKDKKNIYLRMINKLHTLSR